jgi:biotin transport system substrate-specific component
MLRTARLTNLTLNWNPEGSPVSNPVSVATAPVAAAPAWLRTVGIALAGSALVAVCAHLALPLFFTPVPLSLAPFAVLLLGLVLSPRQAATTLAAYLAEGAMGLPVFTPSALTPGGLAHLLGPTGGYLLTYPLTAGLIALLWRRSGRGFGAALASAAAGSLTILAGGALWLAALTHISAQAAIALAVYLAEGAMGLPVFTPNALTPGGLAHLLGPTGGYLLAYPLAAGLIALLWRRSGRGFGAALASAAAGSLTILAGGALWLAALTHISAQAAIALAVVPFLPGDALKVAAAAALAVSFQRLRRHTA